MAKAKNTENKIRIIVQPATDNADKEGFAKVNGKIIPFGVPVFVDKNDIKVLERMKEPRTVNRKTDPRAIMEELRITQEKANRIARMQERENMNKSIRYVNKYFVKVV